MTDAHELKITLGLRIRALRRAAGIAQSELATLVGVPQPRISELERGLAWPSADRWVALCGALGVKPHDLLE